MPKRGKSKGKKGKKGEGKGKKAGKVIDGLSTSEMSREQLLGHIKRLQAEIEREREERNFFMLEREKLFSLWNMSVETLAMEKEKAKLAEIHMENAEQENQDEVNFSKRKLRFVLAEQSSKIGQIRLGQMRKMRAIQNDSWIIQTAMREGIDKKRREQRLAELSLKELLRRMRMEHAEEIGELRRQFSEEVRRIEVALDRKFDQDHERTEVDKKGKITEIRIAKEKQLEQMLQMHEKQLLDMKTFFNDLTVNNFAVLTSLQNEVAAKKAQEQRLRRQMREAMEKHESLLVPLRNMEQKLTDWADDGKQVAVLKGELAIISGQLESNKRYTHLMDCAHEALIQKSVYVRRERDLIKDAFKGAILEMQKKSSMNRLVLEMKLRSISKESAITTAYNDALTKGGADGVDYLGEYVESLKDPLLETKLDISDGATEFSNNCFKYRDAMTKASIHPDEIAYQVRKIGAKARPKDVKRTERKSRGRGHHNHSGSIHSTTVSDLSAAEHVAAHKPLFQFQNEYDDDEDEERGED